MVAALSPADINYDETLSTLRCVLKGGGPCAPAWHGGRGGSLLKSGTWARGVPLGQGGCLCCDSLRLRWPSGGAWVLMGPLRPRLPSGCTLGLRVVLGACGMRPGELCPWAEQLAPTRWRGIHQGSLISKGCRCVLKALRDECPGGGHLGRQPSGQVSLSGP